MFIVGNFILAIAKVLDIALTIYMWIIIIRAVISWFSPSPYNPLVNALYRMTEPVLYWVRRKIPVIFGGFDFSPIVVILAIIFLKTFLVKTLYQIAVRISL